MKLPLRARRDIDGVLTAIKASAVAHRIQRDVEKGRIVATVDDYRWAHIAFASGLAELYRPQVGQNVLALVRVIEQAIAEKRRKAADKQTIHAEQITSVNEVELSHDQIASNLGLSSRTSSPTESARPSPPALSRLLTQVPRVACGDRIAFW